jgi:hypothetical protein
MFKSTAKFVIAMFVMTIVCTIVWNTFVFGRLYYCSDPVWDYLHPGDWVHTIDGHPPAVVHYVVAGPRNGFDTDTIKEGWSMTRLLHLWYCFVAISIVISILLAWIRWIPKRIYEDTHAV